MEYLKCPHCGDDLIFEEGIFLHHKVSADGEYFIDYSAFGLTFRSEERLYCNHCGTPIEWDRTPDGNIILI